MDRRRFLKSSAASIAHVAGIAGILEAGRPAAYAQGTRLHLLRWVDFIPEADVEIKRQMTEASRTLGVEVTLELINANDLQPRLTAAIQSGTGPDIVQLPHNWAHLYRSALVDVSDLVDARPVPRVLSRPEHRLGLVLDRFTVRRESGVGRLDRRLLRRVENGVASGRKMAGRPSLDRAVRHRVSQVMV